MPESQTTMHRRVLAYTSGLSIKTAQEIHDDMEMTEGDPEVKGEFKIKIMERYREALKDLKEKPRKAA